jgi:uncharacterized iron-regulated protein
MNVKQTGKTLRDWAPRDLLFVCVPVLMLFFSGCAKLTRIPDVSSLKPGTFVDRAGQPYPQSDLVDRMSRADYILIGETHTNPCDHQVQARVIELLQSRGVDVAVGLEMVPAEMQPVLDRFNAGGLGLDELEKALEWRRVWGHDFSLYRPVFQAVDRVGLSLHGLNVKQGLLESLRDKGRSGLSQEERESMPDQIIPVPPEQKEFLLEQFEEHKTFMDDTEGQADQDRFFLVQALWDTQMALQAMGVRGRTGIPVLVLCGTGHVEFGWGIPHRLKILDPKASILAIVPWRGDERPDAEAGDAFYFCPPQHWSRLGFTMEFDAGGVEIVEVREGSRAALAGVKLGDVLKQVGGEPLDEILDLHHAAIKAMKSGEPLPVTVERDGQDIELGLELEKPIERNE